jgi:glycosyltransferase involved in cell wall biosynthesis
LKKYWKRQLPDAEIIIGHDYFQPFSKTSAVNDAARKAKGDVFVILDADVILDPAVIERCAELIMESEARGYPLWFIPYRRAYRLTQFATSYLLDRDPKWYELDFDEERDRWMMDDPSTAAYGHRYGAMCQIMSRTAFFTVGGMDCRFRGWGGEDVSHMRAVDTLYGKHKTTNNPIWHLAHFKIGNTYQTREWSRQARPLPNGNLAQRYYRALGDKVRMRNLVREGHDACQHPNFFDRLIEVFRCVRFW